MNRRQQNKNEKRTCKGVNGGSRSQWRRYVRRFWSRAAKVDFREGLPWSVHYAFAQGWDN